MAAVGFEPPKFQVNDSANAYQAWRDYKASLSVYFVAADLDGASAERKVAILKYGLGPNHLKTFQGFGLSNADQKDYDTVVKAFEEHFEPKKLTKLYMKKFDSCVQKPNQSVADYITELRDIASFCDYGATLDPQLCKQLSSGVKDKALRDRLWGEDLPLDQLIAKCHLHEQRVESADFFRGEQSETVHFTRKGPSKWNRGQHYNAGNRMPESDTQSSKSASRDPCPNCVGSHSPGHCPARGRRCRFCKCLNHFEVACRKKRNVHFNKEDPEENYDDGDYSDKTAGFVYAASNVASSDPKNWTVPLTLSNHHVLNFKIDTGADVSCISLKTYQQFVDACLINSETPIVGVSSKSVRPVGQTRIKVVYKSKCYRVTCQVLNCNIPNLLGREDCLMMNLVARVNTVKSEVQNADDAVPVDDVITETDVCFDDVKCNSSETMNIVKQYKDVFVGTGKMPGVVSLKIDPDCTPVAHPPRPIPEALRQAAQVKLELLEKEDIIEKIPLGVPTPWCSPMHIVLKKKPEVGKQICASDLRITIDPKDLNQALLREYHPINTVDEIIRRTHGSELFSKLDARQGFFQLVLDEESSLLTAFNTPFGRFRYNRLPMGISAAPEIYQRVMQELFGDVKGCEVIFDDLLIHGATNDDHDVTLKQVLQIARDNNVVFNVNKMSLCNSQVEYVGHILSDKGVKVSPDKVSAVVNMPKPKSIANVQTFLGMVNYTCKFLPHMSSLTLPLRSLIKESADPQFKWHWDRCHDEAFSALKDAMINAPVLGYYSLDKPITLSVDSSQSGLGAVIYQDGKPVHFASKALTAAEYNYAQIEKELLAICWGFEKFHTYLYGRSDITVITDHKPLVKLREKPLFQLSPRLQAMCMKLRQHTFELIHKPGKEIPVPDCMSRMYCGTESNDDTFLNYAFLATCLSSLAQSDDPVQVDLGEVRSTNAITQAKLLEVKGETVKDDVLQKLISVIQSPRYPKKMTDLDPDVRPYYPILHELSVENGVVYKGERVVIPGTLRKHMLTVIHESHLGIVKCKQFARDLVYWPGINNQIDDVVSRCETCQSNRKKQQKEPLLPVEVPTGPWQVVACDLFDHGKNKTKYLIIADYYSDWFEVEALPESSNATNVIGKTSKWFAQQGIPSKVITDNGPPFNSYQYTEFAAKYGFAHQTISPYHSQANGFIEKYVGIAKAMMTKCEETKQDLYLALLNHRNTPMGNLGSPAQRLLGRRTRTRLPTAESLLKPSALDPSQVTKDLVASRQKSKNWYDQHTKPLPQLAVGDSIRVRSQKKGTWEPARLIDSSDTLYRSHRVITPQGKVYRRNRRDILKTREDRSVYDKAVRLHDDTVINQLDDVFADTGLSTVSDSVCDQTAEPRPVSQGIPNAKTVTKTISDVMNPNTSNAECSQSVSRYGRMRKPNPKYAN